MKKKLLLFMSMLILIASVFVITVFAQEETELRTSVTYEGNTYPINRYEYELSSLASTLGNSEIISDMEAILDENSVVILKDSDGNLAAYPTYYVIQLNPQADDDYGAYIAINEMNYSFVNSKSGKSYEKGSVVYIEFPEGMTRVRNNGVFGKKQVSGYEVNVTDIVIPTTVTRMERAFYGNTSLKRVTIKEGALLQNIGENAFCDCTALESITLSHLTELVSIDECAFQRCTALASLDLPNTVQSIGTKAFDGCTNLTFASSYLPSSLTSIGEYFCSGVKKLNNTLIFPEGITIIPQEAFGNATTADGGTLNLVFLGEMSGNTMLNGNDYRAWAEQVIIYFAKNSLSDYTATLYTVGTDGSLTQGTSQTGSFWIKPSNGAPTNTTTIFEKALMLVFCENATPEISYMLNNAGTAITEATTYSNNGTITDSVISHSNASQTHIYTTENKDCSGTGICIICECANQITHTEGEIISIEYKNGFSSQGDINYNCPVCSSTYSEENTADAIFIPHGYSYKLDGTSEGIAAKFEINRTALALYESENECELHFGIIMANQEHFVSGDGVGFIENGVINTNGRGIQVEIISDEYSYFNCIVSGFESGSYNSLKLVIAGYAYEVKNEISGEISYFQKAYSTSDDDEITNDTPYLQSITRNGVSLGVVTIGQVEAYHEYVESKEQ